MSDIVALSLPDLLLITPRRHVDSRGYFVEFWNAATMAAHGLDPVFVQDAASLSRAIGTLRGLHCQHAPYAQAKLVRVGRGRIRDVAVDARRGSPTYGQWASAELSAEGGEMLWVPRGFLHGFVTLESDTEVIYKIDNAYSPGHAVTVRFDDPDIGVDWGASAGILSISPADAAGAAFADFVPSVDYAPS